MKKNKNWIEKSIFHSTIKNLSRKKNLRSKYVSKNEGKLNENFQMEKIDEVLLNCSFIVQLSLTFTKARVKHDLM